VIAATLKIPFGIDFTGGNLVEFESKLNITEVRQKINANRDKLAIKSDYIIQNFGADDVYLLRIGGANNDQLAENIRAVISGSDIRRVEYVGPSIGDLLIEKGLTAITLSLLAVFIYIWFRFEWQFSLAAIGALLHDLIISFGLIILLDIEISLALIAAFLTIAGYSINDTVVVFDRMREKLRLKANLITKENIKSFSIIELLDESLNDTLSRTILTSATTLIALICLWVLGGAALRDFTSVLIIGVIVGTYSSVYVAPFLLRISRVNVADFKPD
jgi:preprotein translocase SecF subunit